MTVPTWNITPGKCPNCQKKLNKVTKKGDKHFCGYCGFGLPFMLSGGPAYVADSGSGSGGAADA
jgi:hypothetical protein